MALSTHPAAGLNERREAFNSLAERRIANPEAAGLFRILRVSFAAGDGVGAGEPTVKIDIAATLRAERP